MSQYRVYETEHDGFAGGVSEWNSRKDADQAANGMRKRGIGAVVVRVRGSRRARAHTRKPPTRLRGYTPDSDYERREAGLREVDR